jgi:peptidoglycan/xylan/chitin deacetylase (PgdA/CDA1 family)
VKHSALYARLSSLRRRYFGAIHRFVTALPVAALTFDDGPHPKYTPRLLEVLGRYKAHATFFMVGEAAQRYPEIVRAVAEAGHAIGNHSWDHPRFPDISSVERRRQIQLCAREIAPYDCNLFRPPFGSENLRTYFDVRLAGYRLVNWSIGVPDWLGYDADWLEPRILRQFEPGSVLLFHDGLYGASSPEFLDRGATIEVVERILRRTRDQCRFVTLPEMFQAGKPETLFLPSAKEEPAVPVPLA